LILSELTGAADELHEALRINPNDTSSIVAALKTALTMPLKQQQQRMHSMQERISHYTVQRWASDFIGQLRESSRTRSDSTQIITPTEQEEIIREFRQARERAIFLDYDGTLANFVNTPNPNSAKPSRQLIQLLRTITTLPNTRLYIVSGRKREALQSWFGGLPVTLVAEHGSWIKQRGEWAQSLFSFRDTKTLLLPLLERYAERTPGAFIEEKDFSLVWHYRTVKPELAYARNSNLRHDIQALIGDTDVGIVNGNKIIEIKHRTTQKGAVVSEILESEPADFIFCAGDDYTDEDMFVALADAAYTVKVGPGKTQARFRVASVEKLVAVLQSIASPDAKMRVPQHVRAQGD
jgi:trehalose 6-phosphate synthase/phosphatase